MIKMLKTVKFDGRDFASGCLVAHPYAAEIIAAYAAEEGHTWIRMNPSGEKESPVGREKDCVGWLANQLGPGNNIALRLAVRVGRVSADFELVGKQHPRFEDTLPRAKR